MSMSMARQFTRLVVALLIVVTVAGCAGSSDQVGDETAAQAGSAPGLDPGALAPDAPGEASGEEAAGTPGAGPEDPAPDAPGARAGKQAPGTPAGGSSRGAPGSAGAPGSPGASGLPGSGSPDEQTRAPSSPITIPEFQQIGGQPVDDVRQQIEAKIREACTPDHDLCVTTKVKPPNGEGLFCGTDPPTFPGPAEVPRGSVLTIYSAPEVCPTSEASDEPPPAGDSEPSEAGQPPSNP